MNRKWGIVIAMATLAMSGLACGGNDATPLEPTPLEPTPTAGECDEYWAAENAKTELRDDAIRRDAVIVEWRGDWNANARLALFRGLGHVSDVTVGTQFMDLVERDQITLNEYDGDAWFAVVNIPNNLQPGGTIVFVR